MLYILIFICKYGSYCFTILYPAAIYHACKLINIMYFYINKLVRIRIAFVWTRLVATNTSKVSPNTATVVEIVNSFQDSLNDIPSLPLIPLPHILWILHQVNPYILQEFQELPYQGHFCIALQELSCHQVIPE